ncbi:MAG TPA: hypothetical protein VMV92_39355 [Streptosporangiaceae bacterium]|nr:hypothetical protein [Streptosporangiaceae bacterium]
MTAGYSWAYGFCVGMGVLGGNHWWFAGAAAVAAVASVHARLELRGRPA